jgi:putative phosphoribosyl transferase
MTFRFGNALLNFDFRGSDDGGVLARGDGREVDLFGAPALVTQQAPRRLAICGHVAEQFYHSGVIGLDLRERALHAVNHGGEPQITPERFAALIVQIAHGRAHLVVRIGGNIFHQEIDEARVPLQDPQNLQGAVGRFGLWRGGRFRGGWRFRLGETERLGDVQWKFSLKQNGEETAKCESDASQNLPLGYRIHFWRQHPGEVDADLLVKLDMERAFRDRTEAGQRLAAALRRYIGDPGAVVLGLPRGGVPVAYEVARALRAPLDVMVVRKLGVPGHGELAMGAIARGGVRVINASVVDSLRIPNHTVDAVAEHEARELERRERAYRGDLPPANLNGRIVILVDDGLATGSTMRAAVAAVRQCEPARIVVAVPVAAGETIAKLRREVDDVIYVAAPQDFHAVSLWYREFPQTTDEEVRRLLEAASVAARGD